jgi:subtilisin family serine protease
MKNKLYWILIIAICLSTFGGKPRTVLAQQRSPTQNINAAYVHGQMIVVYRQGLTRDVLGETSRAIAETMSGKVLKVRGNAALLAVNESLDIPNFTTNFATELQAIDPAIKNTIRNVAYTQPNYIYDVPTPGPGTPGEVTPPVTRPNEQDDNPGGDEVAAIKKAKSTPILPTYPEDPYLYNSWGWWSTNTDVVWQDKAASAMVCVLDTGVDAAHPDLVGRVVNGWDVVNNDAVPDDDNGHGTHLAGIIAAISNNKKGIAGISRAQVYAVKVMDYLGQGSSWDINYGIKLCANNPAVKVINMSFGSSAADGLIFAALEYAINVKGKLAVVAAGNSSTSGNFPSFPGYADYPSLSFPAAWAGEFVCSDGWIWDPSIDCRNDPPFSNTITDGLISVAAGSSYWSSYAAGSDGYLWVDTNGNGFEDVTDYTNPAFWDEHFFPSDCAAGFSNFGAWVTLVAPGESITSTVPVSYPFFQQYNWGADPDGDGYDTWNGTSMAAPFVSGVAARVWSIGSSLFNGAAPTAALVKSRLINTGYSPFTSVDPNTSPPYWGYYASYSGEAPYCWPNASQGTLYDTSNARILNAANAMNRTTLYIYVYNALNGLPLKGTTVGAYIGTSVKSQALMNSNFSAFAILPNLPRGKTYAIKINKTGFTNGQVTITQQYIDPTDYSYLSGPNLSVSVPPMGKITGVLDWVVYDAATSDMDLYSWLPNNIGAVGYASPFSPPFDGPPFIGKGRLLDDPNVPNDPFARWNVDGGAIYAWTGTESISIMPRPGYPTMPYYNTTSLKHYDFLVHEWELGALNSNKVYFRLWVGGKIKATVLKSDICGPGETWWKAGYMVKDKFFPADTCGGSNIWPY